jgi:hypothetical protein
MIDAGNRNVLSSAYESPGRETVEKAKDVAPKKPSWLRRTALMPVVTLEFEQRLDR